LPCGRFANTHCRFTFATRHSLVGRDAPIVVRTAMIAVSLE
jgi:hypothetical protein